MRTVHQGAGSGRDGVSDGRAGTDRRAGRCRRATRPPHLTASAPIGVVLAGGASRRFGGGPKGLELVGGRRIVDRVADALQAVTSGLVLAANSDEALKWLIGVPILADRVASAGGLGGVDAALAKGGDVLVVAWDMPFVTRHVLSAILTRAHETDANVVVPESSSPFGFEPYCAFYSGRVAGPLSRFLSSGGRAPRDFFATIGRVERLPAAAIAGDPAKVFMSVNSPSDLAVARSHAEASP